MEKSITNRKIHYTQNNLFPGKFAVLGVCNGCNGFFLNEQLSVKKKKTHT